MAEPSVESNKKIAPAYDCLLTTAAIFEKSELKARESTYSKVP